MAVKMRLRRMGQKKGSLSIELLLQIPELQETADSSRRLVTTIQT